MIRLGNGLLIINLLVAGLVAVIAFLPAATPLRVVLGIPVMLFCPGYALLMAIFPRRSSLDQMERLVLSAVMSIAFVPLVVLVLSYTLVGITLTSVLVSIVVFVVAASIVALFRQRRLTVEDRIAVSLVLKLPGLERYGPFPRAVLLGLVVILLGAVGSFAYVAAQPRAAVAFTEFYVLGSQGKAADYETELTLEQSGSVRLVVVSHEREAIDFKVQISINGRAEQSIGPIPIEPGARWENRVSFTPATRGESQKVEFTLYKDGQNTPYLGPLVLFVNVK